MIRGVGRLELRHLWDNANITTDEVDAATISSTVAAWVNGRTATVGRRQGGRYLHRDRR